MDAKNGWKWPAFSGRNKTGVFENLVFFFGGGGGIHWNLSKRFVWDRVNGFETKLVDFVTPLRPFDLSKKEMYNKPFRKYNELKGSISKLLIYVYNRFGVMW